MSVRHEELSEAEVARQADLDRSWTAAHKALSDPEFRTELENSITRVNQSTSTASLSKEEFLAATEPTPE